MAILLKETKFSIFTTPAELRKLADTLERKHREAKLGDSLILETWIDKGVKSSG